MSWSFGISQCTTWPWSFAEDLARYGALGASAIELWEFKLDADPGRRREQVAAAAAAYRVCSFQADVHSLFPTRMRPQPQAPGERRDAFLRTLETVAPLLPDTVFVLNTGVAAGGNVQAAYEETVAGYRELAARAAAAGVRLALEPLHPLAMNEDTYAWNLEDALEIVQAVDAPVFGICADAWNLAGQYDLGGRIARCAGRIFLAQLADYRRPRSYLDRLPVGEGTLDLAPFLAGLRAARYDGPLVFELFSRDVGDSFYDRDMAAGIARTRAALAPFLEDIPSVGGSA